MKILLLTLVVVLVSCHIQSDIRSGKVKMKGANLGGWLVAEHWMTSDSIIWQGLPDGVPDQGEYQVMEHWGHDQGDWRFEQHRNTWITEQDIKEIAASGLNTVRVPVGYWLAGFDMTGGTAWQVFAPGALKYLDKLIKEWGTRYNIAVLISIHAAKGSQNGNDHSAPPTPGKAYWAQYPENIQNTVDFAWFLANRYKNEPAFLGLGMLNEPGNTTDEETIIKYYRSTIQAIRGSGIDCILATAPLVSQQDQWHLANLFTEYNNIWHDWHKYLIWGYEGQNDDQIMWAGVDGISQQVREWKGNKLMVGEWSIATNPAYAPFNDDAKFKQYAQRYLDAIQTTQAGFTYWTWKCSYDENGRNPWSLRQMIRNGVFNFH